MGTTYTLTVDVVGASLAAADDGGVDGGGGGGGGGDGDGEEGDVDTC